VSRWEVVVVVVRGGRVPTRSSGRVVEVVATWPGLEAGVERWVRRPGLNVLEREGGGGVRVSALVGG
jgi:hypothetical protein